jgi:hypothetical protein
MFKKVFWILVIQRNSKYNKAKAHKKAEELLQVQKSKKYIKVVVHYLNARGFTVEDVAAYEVSALRHEQRKHHKRGVINIMRNALTRLISCPSYGSKTRRRECMRLNQCCI